MLIICLLFILLDMSCSMLSTLKFEHLSCNIFDSKYVWILLIYGEDYSHAVELTGIDNAICISLYVLRYVACVRTNLIVFLMFYYY